MGPREGSCITPYAIASARTPDTGLTCLVVLSRFFGIACCDADLLRHQFAVTGQPFGESEVLRAVRRLGVKINLYGVLFVRASRTFGTPAIESSLRKVGLVGCCTTVTKQHKQRYRNE